MARLVEASQPETARLWVAYSSGLEAPLEPQLSAGHLSDLGYISHRFVDFCLPRNYSLQPWHPNFDTCAACKVQEGV